MSVPAYDWIAHHARYSPKNVAIRDLYSNRTFTYAGFDERVSRAALYLINQLGVRRGDRIALLCHNSSDVFEVQFACQRAGAIFLPMNWRLAVPELEFICNDAEPRVLVYSPDFAEAAHEVGRRCNIPHLVETADGADSGYERGLASAQGTLPRIDLTHDDIWTVLYTSGTTGRPKGAQGTYGNVFFNTINCAMKALLTSESASLVYLPTFHVGGLHCYANPLFHLGGATVMMRTFDPEHSLALLSDPESGVTHALGVPTNFLFMSQLSEFADAKLDHLVSVGIGGAAAPESLLRLYGEKGVMFQQAWGMTETTTLGTILSRDKALEKLGSSGLPVMHTALRIVDHDGNDVEPGGVGELLIKGPTVTPGYWKRPEANQTSFTDGWFHTGDAARTDEDGYYYIVDRWKDMYISGGENVYPVEVENVIFELDGIAETAVIGVADEKWGEVGRAFVVLREGSNLSEDAIIAHCRDNLAKFKCPVRVVVMPELPHNATGKVTKHELPRE